MPTFDEILALASLPEDTVTLCLDGRVLDEIGALQRQLAEAPAPTSLADDTAARLREQLAAAAERMRASQVEFRLRALPGPEWNRFYGSSPDRGENETEDDWNARWLPWVFEMVSRTVVDPAMTRDEERDQVAELAGRLHAVAWNQLSNACWALNRNEVRVPNFEPVSGETPSSNGTSRRPSSTGSATAASGDGSPAKQRRTTTTRTAASSAA